MEAGDSGTFVRRDGPDLVRGDTMSSLALGASFRIKRKGEDEDEAGLQ